MVSREDECRPAPVWPVVAMLGEGPAWFAHEAALRFVAIEGGRPNRFDPATGALWCCDRGKQPLLFEDDERMSGCGF